MTALKQYTVEAAKFSTNGDLPLTFEKNHRYYIYCKSRRQTHKQTILVVVEYTIATVIGVHHS